MSSLRQLLLDELAEASRRALARRRELWQSTRSELADLESLLAPLEGRAAEVDARLAGVADELALMDAPFTPELTVDQAWRRHPGTRVVFAGHGLPGCDGCSVRFDETLAEVAQTYALPLEGLLDELNALLGA